MTIPARLCKDPLGLASLMILVLLLAAGLLAPLIAPHDPLAVDAAHKFAGCSPEHWLGTDHLGRDLFSRLLFGVRTTLFLALAIMLPTLVLATLLGLTAGLVRGLPGALILRLCDIMLAFPSSVLILAVVGMLGPGAGNILLACLLAKWPWYTRMIATMARQYADRNSVLWARVAGLGTWHLVRRHLLPSVAGELCVLATLDTGAVILLISGLSFLGLGVQPPTPEWGMMLSEARSVLAVAPWQMLPPGIMLLVVVAACSFLGDALRDCLDPRRGSSPDVRTDVRTDVGQNPERQDGHRDRRSGL